MESTTWDMVLQTLKGSKDQIHREPRPPRCLWAHAVVPASGPLGEGGDPGQLARRMALHAIRHSMRQLLVLPHVQAMGRHLHGEGFTALLYADDLLLLGESEEEVCRALIFVLGRGLQPRHYHQPQKSFMKPTQVIKYLGQVINLRERTVSLTSDEKSGVVKRCKYLHRRATATPRLAGSLAGALLDAAKGIAPLMGLGRQLSSIFFLYLR